MKKTSLILLFPVAIAPWVTERCRADTSVITSTVTATISSAASLSVGATTVTFANANPASVSSIPATENGTTLTINARTSATGVVLLTVISSGDLVSGSNTIPISDVTWTSSGTGFQSGTMNKSTAQTIGSWTGSGSHSGTINFFLANSFSYTTGTYTANLTYTLLAP